MSHFYSTIQGNRGEATRCGTKDSGIMASARSWSGSITVYLDVDDQGDDCYRICVGEGSVIGGRCLWAGKLRNLLNPNLTQSIMAYGEHLHSLAFGVEEDG